MSRAANQVEIHALTILVVDDDPVMTELLTAVLSMEGHDVTEAGSGEAALDALKAGAFDVVLTDLQLPGLQSVALARALRSAMPETTRLIGMSGSEPRGEEQTAYDAFLLKPFTTEDFARAVDAALEPNTALTATADERPATDILDEAIVARLGKQLPAAKLKELYQLTVSDIAKRLDKMEAAQTAGDEDTIRREAHAIKGGCGMVGAMELHRMAAQREGGSPPDTPTLVEFRSACDRLRRMLDARFDGL